MTKAKVLIADDDITLMDMYKLRLEADDFEVVTAEDGEQAIAQVRKENPDAVLLDIMMPKINGLDVLAELKKDPHFKNTPVIMLTALIQDVTKIKSLMTGADDYLMKSEVMPGEVIAKVNHVLEMTKQKKLQTDEAK
jgi:two-component system alkaline phosphatase synthesis response regulator PhoP